MKANGIKLNAQEKLITVTFPVLTSSNQDSHSFAKIIINVEDNYYSISL